MLCLKQEILCWTCSVCELVNTWQEEDTSSDWLVVQFWEFNRFSSMIPLHNIYEKIKVEVVHQLPSQLNLWKILGSISNRSDRNIQKSIRIYVSVLQEQVAERCRIQVPSLRVTGTINTDSSRCYGVTTSSAPVALAGCTCICFSRLSLCSRLNRWGGKNTFRRFWKHFFLRRIYSALI